MENNQNEVVKKSTTVAMIVLVVLSSVLLVVGGIIKSVYHSTFWEVLSLLMITIGSVGCTSFVGTLFLTSTGLLETIKIQLSEIMVDMNFINLLDRQTLEKLRRNINEKLYSKEIAQDKNSLLNTVTSAITPLFDQIYFQKYEVDVQIKIENDKIIKEVARRMVLVNPSAKSSIFKYRDIFAVAFRSDDPVGEARIKTFKVNGENRNVIMERAETAYTADYLVRYELDSKDDEGVAIGKEPVEIRILTETVTALDDALFVHKLPFVCKDYVIKVSYNPTECAVYGAPFGFMDFRPKKQYYIGKVADYIETISFNDWILPGDGVAFAIEKKVVKK